MIRSSLLWALVVLVLPCGAADACGNDDKPKVKVTLVVILAGEGEGKSDPRLEAIAKEIRKQNPSLRCFSIHSQVRESLAEKETRTFPIIDKQTVTVVVRQKADADNKVILGVTVPDQGEIVYRSACGKFLPIVTRYRTKDKERLILAVRVEPCNGD